MTPEEPTCIPNMVPPGYVFASNYRADMLVSLEDSIYSLIPECPFEDVIVLTGVTDNPEVAFTAFVPERYAAKVDAAWDRSIRLRQLFEEFFKRQYRSEDPS